MAKHYRPYTVKRISPTCWKIKGNRIDGINAALKECGRLDEQRGFDWDFDTEGQCRDGLEALKVGESIKVEYPEDDE